MKVRNARHVNEIMEGRSCTTGLYFISIIVIIAAILHGREGITLGRVGSWAAGKERGREGEAHTCDGVRIRPTRHTSTVGRGIVLFLGVVAGLAAPEGDRKGARPSSRQLGQRGEQREGGRDGLVLSAEGSDPRDGIAPLRRRFLQFLTVLHPYMVCQHGRRMKRRTGQWTSPRGRSGSASENSHSLIVPSSPAE